MLKRSHFCLVFLAYYPLLYSLLWSKHSNLYMNTHSRPMEMRCWPMRRTISWSVCERMRAGGGRSPLAASPLRWRWCAPFVHGWCMASGRASGDSLRVRLRGGRCPAASSPDSLEARLPASARTDLTGALAASAETHPRTGVTPATTRLHSTISLCSPQRNRCFLIVPPCRPCTRPAFCESRSTDRTVIISLVPASNRLLTMRTQKSAENEFRQLSNVFLYRSPFFAFRVTFVFCSLAHCLSGETSVVGNLNKLTSKNTSIRMTQIDNKINI